MPRMGADACAKRLQRGVETAMHTSDRQGSGLQCPWGFLQVLLLVLQLGTVTVTYSIVIPFFFFGGAAATLGTLNAILVVTVLSLYVWTALVDTTDPLVAKHDVPGPLYCCACQSAVSASSKHCRVCDRCVLGFDHHCMWLRTCIGSANYRHFVALLVVTASMLGLQTAMSCTGLVWSLSRPLHAHTALAAWHRWGYNLVAARVRMHLLSYLARPRPPPPRVGLGLSLVVSAIALVAVGDLLLFHAILSWKGITTYDYILAHQSPHAQSRLDLLLACITCSSCGGGVVAVSPCRALLTSARRANDARSQRNRRLVHPAQDTNSDKEISQPRPSRSEADIVTDRRVCREAVSDLESQEQCMGALHDDAGTSMGQRELHSAMKGRR